MEFDQHYVPNTIRLIILDSFLDLRIPKWQVYDVGFDPYTS